MSYRATLGRRAGLSLFLKRSFIQPLERRVVFAAGELDASFAGDGTATILGNDAFSAVDVVVQPSGKTLVLGSRGGMIAIARYDLAGNLDTTFGANGTGYATASYADLNGNVPSVGSAAFAIQPADGKIVVVGSWSVLMALTRFTAEGVLDPTFSGDGRLVVDPFDTRGDVTGRDIAIQSNGRIVVAAHIFDGDSDFGIARFLDNGAPDNSFSGDGAQIVGFGQDEQPDALTLDANGRIVVVGNSVSETRYDLQFAIARLMPNGDLDGGFSGDGKVLSRFTGNTLFSRAGGVVVQSTGKIVIAGAVGSADFDDHDIGLFRLNDDGTGDPTFGVGNGQTLIDFGVSDSAESLLIGQAGQLIVGGSRGLVSGGASPRRTTIACLTENGLLDTAFGGGDAKLEVDFGTAPGLLGPEPISASALGLALGLNGTIVVAGGEQYATARLFDRRFATISVGTFQPQMYEQGAVGTSFFLTRSERLPTPTRVFLSTAGQARPPNTFPVRPRDYNGEGISFGDGQTSTTYVDIPANATFVTVTLTPVDDTLVEGDETAVFSIVPNAAYDPSASRTTTLVIRDNDVSAGPTVSEAAFLFETAPQRLTFRFNQSVINSLTASDLVLTGPAGIPTSQFAYDSLTNTATYSFHGMLPDGNYQARFVAATVTNLGGTPMPADFTLPFFALAGDANRDRTVGFSDLLILAQNYGQPGKTFSQGNFDYSADGLVGFNDLLLLAQRYNTSVLMTEPTLPRRRGRVAGIDSLAGAS
jgi:uncharacterized delta-60 repeat protein